MAAVAAVVAAVAAATNKRRVNAPLWFQGAVK